MLLWNLCSGGSSKSVEVIDIAFTTVLMVRSLRTRNTRTNFQSSRYTGSLCIRRVSPAIYVLLFLIIDFGVARVQQVLQNSCRVDGKLAQEDFTALMVMKKRSLLGK